MGVIQEYSSMLGSVISIRASPCSLSLLLTIILDLHVEQSAQSCGTIIVVSEISMVLNAPYAHCLGMTFS